MVRPNPLRRFFAKASEWRAADGRKDNPFSSVHTLRNRLIHRPQQGRPDVRVDDMTKGRGLLGPFFVWEGPAKLTLRLGLVFGLGASVHLAAQEPGEANPKVVSSPASKPPLMGEPPDPGPVAVGGGGDSLQTAAVADMSILGMLKPGKTEAGLRADSKGRAAALAHYSAALQAEANGDMKKAFEHYREVMRGDVEEAGLVRRAAALAVRYGSEKEAEALLVERMTATPGKAGPTLRLVEFLDAYQSSEESGKRADELMEGVLPRFPQDSEVAIAVVLRHLVKGRRDQAIQVLKATVDGVGGDAAHWLALAGVAQEVWPLGQTELAEEHRKEVNVFYERALAEAVKSKDRTRELEVAQYYVLSNQLPAAKKVCEVMVARDGDLTARKILYRLYESEELKEKAFALLEGIVRDDPKDVMQRRLLADVLEKRQQFPEAARHLEAAIQVGAGTAADYEKLTNLWLGLQQPDKAITLVTRAIRLFPDTPGFLAQAAMAYAAKEDFPRAIESFAEAERLGSAGGEQSFNHRFYFRYGVVLEQAERYEEADAQLRRSIEMTPEAESDFLANTMNYLGYMWVEVGQKLDEAEKLIQGAVKLEPDNAAFIDSLGWLYHKQGRNKESLTELKRAEVLLKELQPGDAEILDHIAVVQEALGQKAEALESFKRAAALQTPDKAVALRILEGLKRLGGIEKSK